MGCAISDQSMTVPGGMIQRTDHFCVHQDPLIPVPGFLVIASVRHIRSISQMRADEYEEFSRLLKNAHQAIKDVTRVENLTIIQEESSVHFHLWFFPWTGSVVEKYGKPSLSRIRDIMLDYWKAPISETEWVELKKSIAEIKSRMR